MNNVPPSFETVDLQGSTDTFSGTAGTSWMSVPAVSGNIAQSVIVICDMDQSRFVYLDVSFDGGTTSAGRLYRGGHIAALLKDSKRQISVKGNTSAVKYQVTMNRETY